jgi:hypothetical protein
MNPQDAFDEALALALTLPSKKRLQLIEQVASSVERELDVSPPAGQHWGQALNALLDSLDTGDWEALEIDDPVAWVKQQRAAETARRLGAWGAGQ